MVNQAVEQAFISHSSVMANSVHNAVLKTLQEGGLLGFMGPVYQQASQMVFTPTGLATATPPINPKTQTEGSIGVTQLIGTIVSPQFATCVYKLYTNGHACTRRFYDRIPYWVGSYYWLWYASRVHDFICSRTGKLAGFAADESADNCIGSITDPASRHRAGSIASDSNCISTIANRSNQYVGF